MPGRVLERAVYIRSELLHFCGEFFGLLGLGLVIRCAGHRSAAGVQLSLLQGEQVLQVSSVGAATSSTGQASCASLRYRAVADSLQLDVRARCSRFARWAALLSSVSKDTLARFLPLRHDLVWAIHALVLSYKSFRLQGLPALQPQSTANCASGQ